MAPRDLPQIRFPGHNYVLEISIQRGAVLRKTPAREQGKQKRAGGGVELWHSYNKAFGQSYQKLWGWDAPLNCSS